MVEGLVRLIRVEVRVFSPTPTTPWAPPLGVVARPEVNTLDCNPIATRLQIVSCESANQPRIIRGVEDFGRFSRISYCASRGAIQSGGHTLLVLVATQLQRWERQRDSEQTSRSHHYRVLVRQTN
jgi:hypothetical protein